MAVALRKDEAVFSGWKVRAADDDDVAVVEDGRQLVAVAAGVAVAEGGRLEEKEEGVSMEKSMGGARGRIAPPCWNRCPVQVA